MRANCGCTYEEYVENKGHRKSKKRKAAKKSTKRAAAKTAWRPEWKRKGSKKKAAKKSTKSTWAKKPAGKTSLATLVKQVETAKRILTLALGQLAKRI